MLKETMIKRLKGSSVAREQEEAEVEPTNLDDIATDELIEAEEKFDDFATTDDKSEAINREISEAQEEAEVMAEDIESINNPTDTDVAVSTERLFMFQFTKGLRDFRLVSESAEVKISDDNKVAMKRIAKEFRDSADNFNLAREGVVADKLVDWLYTITHFGKKRFEQLKRELTSKLYKNFDLLDEGEKIKVAKSIARTVAELVYIFNYYGVGGNSKPSKDVVGMLKELRKNGKEFGEQAQEIYKVLNELLVELKKEYPLLATASQIDIKVKGDFIKELLLEMTKKVIKSKTSSVVNDKSPDIRNAIKNLFGSTFATQTLNEYLVRNKGELDTFVNSITLVEAETIGKDLKFIIDDIYDIYEYASEDYIFKGFTFETEEVMMILSHIDPEIERMICKLYTIYGKIKERIHTDIYDAFTTLRKV